jgi:hypothetical protein
MPFGSTARSFYFLSCITVPDFSVTFYFPDLFTSRIYLPSGVFSWYYSIFFLFTDRSHLAIITWLTDYLDLSTSRANALRLPCKPDKFLFWPLLPDQQITYFHYFFVAFTAQFKDPSISWLSLLLSIYYYFLMWFPLLEDVILLVD